MHGTMAFTNHLNKHYSTNKLPMLGKKHPKSLKNLAHPTRRSNFIQIGLAIFFKTLADSLLYGVHLNLQYKHQAFLNGITN